MDAAISRQRLCLPRPRFLPVHPLRQPRLLGLEPALEACLCSVLGLLSGVLVALGHCLLEESWFFVLSTAERRGLIRKLAPSIRRSLPRYRRQSFVAVALPHALLFTVMAHYREGLLSRAQPKVNLFRWWWFAWLAMVGHDAWFYFVHTLIHRIKYLYTTIHQLHHSVGGDLTVFNTAFGDAIDIGLVFTSYYAILMAWLYHQPSWNPLNFLLLGWAFNSVNLMGHCGYDLSVWTCGLASLGILFTPWSQQSKHHYIHHLDPRFNRSLYFTWWDRLFGTYRGSHPKLAESQHVNVE